MAKDMKPMEEIKKAKLGDIIEFHRHKYGKLYGKVTQVNDNAVIVDLTMMGKENTYEYFNTVANHRKYKILKAS